MVSDHDERPTVLGLFDWSAPEADDAESGPSAGRPHTAPSLRDPGFPLPYRADLLPRSAQLSLRLVPPATGHAHRKLRDVVEHRSGVRMDLMVRGAPRALHADAVLAFLEPQLTGLSWVRRRGLPPYASRPAVGISCWWAQELASGTRPAAEVARVMEGIDQLIVFSANQREIFAAAGVDPERIAPVLFGADHTYFAPARVEPRFDVLAVGVDRGRDWDTLVAAARLLSQHRFDIVTGPGRIPERDLPGNVTVHPPTDFATYRDLLRAARLVVVPTFDLAYPTGQSVLLEAMASGRCVVVTGTDAMDEYIDDGRWNLSVPPRDPTALAETISAALADDALRERIGRGAREAVEEHFTFERMWGSVGTVIRQTL
ncbi:glycosyltransferase family 4 protein [Brachybacterium halotolerans subsp. kimchii]|uniref:glycosyltransferase family 4 protein n=1 Tax=Brachybacterium halotolerans TaxID=2795215 RepID=UPI001E40A60B|nr:glycosyltransferase family 4 protein [Brachybacterium halotolerans]UEJ81123.1 glycosyltransferase family 4 protein [Brachybacterium halotolerans subsp. kimchii]